VNKLKLPHYLLVSLSLNAIININMIIKTIQKGLLVSMLVVAISMPHAFANDEKVTGITPEIAVSKYRVTFQDVFQDALSKSNEYKALKQEVMSSNELLNKENKFYYPTVTVGTELKEFFGSPTPEPERIGALQLNLNAKLYGTGVHNRISAAQKNLDSGEYSLKQTELDIYYVVLKYLTKIERTRFYEIESNKLRAELENYYKKQLIASEEGVSSQSNAMEVELNKVRFEEAVFGVVSNVDKYFKELREEIGYRINDDFNQDLTGIDYSTIAKILDQDMMLFDINDMISWNNGLLAELQLIEASKQSAEAQRERFSITLSNENDLTTYGGIDNNLEGNTDKSFIAVNFEYDLFNEQQASSKRSSIHLYLAEKERYFLKLEKFKAQFESLAFKYKTLKRQREANIAQLTLNRKLIENQKREILIDKITYLDVVESMSAFNNAQISLMNLEMNLYDVIYQMMTMKSDKIFD
jgi:outer membrane protein TolC